MGDPNKMDRPLNSLVAVSSVIVLLLAYDRILTMLSPYKSSAVFSPSDGTAMSATIALAEQCTNIWHKALRTSAGGINATWGATSTITTPQLLRSRPKYASPNNFCSLLPADLSAAHLWNENLGRVFEAFSTSNVDYDNVNRLLASRLLKFMTPSQFLEQGHRSRPSLLAWGRLLQKVFNRMKSKEAPLVQVVVFGRAASCAYVQGLSIVVEDGKCQWHNRLEEFINKLLNGSVSIQEKWDIIKVTPIYPPGMDTRTELNTDIVRNGAWDHYLSPAAVGPDVIMSMYGAQNMFLPKRDWKTANDIEYYHQHRKVIQEFIRACSQVPTCSATTKSHAPPLVLLVDEYVGNQQGAIMAENVQARVLQLLSDYYDDTALVSYAEVVRKLVYASDQKSSWLTADGTGSVEETPTNPSLGMFQHQTAGPTAMIITLAYSLLKYTVSYCSEQSIASIRNEDDSDICVLMPKDVVVLANGIPPPVIDTDLCLTNISAFWRTEEKARQDQRHEICQSALEADNKTSGGDCTFAYWGGIQSTEGELDTYFQPFLRGPKIGWTSNGGRLIAIQEQASLHLHFSPQSSDTQNGSIRIYSMRRDGAFSVRSSLLWELSAQGKAKVGMIEGTHDSPATVAWPTVIELDEETVTGGIDLKLQLIQGRTFEIVGMFLCTN